MKKVITILLIVAVLIFVAKFLSSLYLNNANKEISEIEALSETQDVLSTNDCNKNSDCSAMDCSSFGIEGVKQGHEPYCIDNKCQCMCYNCH